MLFMTPVLALSMPTKPRLGGDELTVIRSLKDVRPIPGHETPEGPARTETDHGNGHASKPDEYDGLASDMI